MLLYYIASPSHFVYDHRELGPAYSPEIGAWYAAYTWDDAADQYVAGAIAMYHGNGYWSDAEAWEPTDHTQEFKWCDYIVKQN